MPKENEPDPDQLADLAKSFLPSWARDDAGTDASQLAKRFDGAGSDYRHSGGFQKKPGLRREGRPDVRERLKPRERRPAQAAGTPGAHGADSATRPERRERRPPAESRPTLTGWQVRFLPDRPGLEGLAKQIKSSTKAYTLFDLARLILEKSERYQVELKRESESAPGVWQTKSDGSLWIDEASAMARAIQHARDTLYRRERVACEPPKGSFPGVAKCGFTGALLGPPNYHGYQTRLREVHATHCSHLSLDEYTARIQVERDEALIEQWREEQSERDEFIPLAPDGTDEPARLTSAAEVEAHFREHHAANAVVSIRERVIAPGPSAMNSSAPEILTLTRAAWAEVDRFPLPLAHSLSKHLSGKGLHIFKTRDNITHVASVRPRFLDIGNNPVSDAVREMLEYLGNHPRQPRAEQCQALIALRPLPEGADPTERERAVAADLSWLLHAGHIIDFAGKSLVVAEETRNTEKRSPQPEQ